MAVVHETVLDDALWKAYRLNFHVVPEYRLKNIDGYWMLEEGEELECHPLETMLLGDEIQGTVVEDIASRLQKSVAWVEGFSDGFSQQVNNRKNDEEYRQGYAYGFSREFRVF